jgi:hypothetical protein
MQMGLMKRSLFILLVWYAGGPHGMVHLMKGAGYVWNKLRFAFGCGFCDFFDGFIGGIFG